MGPARAPRVEAAATWLPYRALPRGEDAASIGRRSLISFSDRRIRVYSLLGKECISSAYNVPGRSSSTCSEKHIPRRFRQIAPELRFQDQPERARPRTGLFYVAVSGR
jgi:hypothetical protein